MRGIMTDLAAERDDVELATFVGDLRTGVQIAQAALADADYDILISRGGTAELISHMVDTPVLQVPISGADILQAIKLAENYQEKFAIVGFPSITNNADIICNLMQYRIDTFTIHHEEEVSPLLSRLREDGYTMILCDMIATTTAHKLGLNAILITSSAESIASALEQAVQLSRSYSLLKRRSRLMDLAIAAGQSYVLAYDERDELLYTSIGEPNEHGALLSAAEKFLQRHRQDAVCQMERQIGGKLYSITGKDILLDREKIVLVHMDLKREAVFLDNKGIHFTNRKDDNSEQLTYYYGAANSIGGIRSTIESYVQSPFPVLILGEAGTGKDAAATYLYENGPYANKSFCTIDCELLGEKGWSAMMASPSSPLHDTGCTLYFKNLCHLSISKIKELTSFAEATNLCKRNRLVFSFLTDSDNNADHPICDCLIKKLGCLTLLLPPLRQRAQDISSLATLYINQLNLQLGKQIIGFDPSALEKMKSFGWPHNLDQFKRVLRELVITTPQFYISGETVSACLKKEEEMYLLQSAAPAGNLDLTQTLDRINYDIVRIVMNQEGDSPTRTAARLGLSRSTVWRMLKAGI